MSTELQTTGANTIKGVLTSDYFKKAVSLALPRHCTADRFTRVALSALTRQPKLAECTKESVIKCMLSLSELGLEPDGRRCHLIPFKNNAKGITECTLIIGYTGLAELAQRGGTVSTIHADVVCENDEFVYDRGQLLSHKIDFRRPRGDFYAAYALVRMKDGGEKVEVMSKEDILSCRDSSSGYRAFKAGYSKNNPWVDSKSSEAEMWKKTVFRRCAKWLVLSPEIADALEKSERDADAPLRNVTPGLADLGTEVVVGMENLEQPVVEEPPSQVHTPAPSAPAQSPVQPAKHPYTRRVPAAESPTRPAPAAQPEPQQEAPAPEPESDPFVAPQSVQSPATASKPPQAQLEEFLVAEGITWDIFSRWAGPQGSGNIPNVEQMTGYRDLPADACERFLRARIGLLNMCRMVAKQMPQP